MEKWRRKCESESETVIYKNSETAMLKVENVTQVKVSMAEKSLKNSVSDFVVVANFTFNLPLFL